MKNILEKMKIKVKMKICNFFNIACMCLNNYTGGAIILADLKTVSCFPYIVSCFPYIVSCFPYIVSCFPYIVSCFPYIVSCFPYIVYLLKEICVFLHLVGVVFYIFCVNHIIDKSEGTVSF